MSRKLSSIVGRSSRIRVRRARICKLEECRVLFLVDRLAAPDEDGSDAYCSHEHADRDRQVVMEAESDLRVAAAGGGRY
ncbi:MAG: hypothetical protein GTO41_26005 [Burkholderiales bacterium]|nr:hypothetical protein [Burkholderiales bacterium]